MRPLVLLLCSAALLEAVALPGCKRESQEAVAEAKGAAEQAKRTAEEAAARAQMAAADANARVSQLGQSIQQSVKEAEDQARAGVESAAQKAQSGLSAAGQSIRELGAGDVVVGTLAESTASQVKIRMAQQQTLPIATDSQTRWIVKGAAGAQAGIPTGSFVRVTYIVRDGQKVATQVETLAQ